MPTPLRRRLRLVRRAAVYGVAITLVCMALVLGVASQVLPLAERHPDRIATWLSERAGQPVAFDHVTTQWTRRGPLLQLDGLRIGEGDAGVQIGQAEVLVSMYAGLLPGRSFTELRLRGLSLTLQRGADGGWSVRGLPGQQQEGGDPLKNLEGLGELQVIDGRLTIVAPSLEQEVVLPRIDLRLRVDGDRVRAGARAWIREGEAPLLASLDFLRSSGNGRAYLALEPADAGAWSPVFHYAGVSVQGGRGKLQGWAELRRHRVVLATTEVQLQEVDLQGTAAAAAAPAPQLRLDRLEGRMRWRLVSGGWRLDAPLLRIGGQPSVQVLDGLVLAGGRQYALLADRIDAAPLFSVLGLSDHLDPGLRQWLAQAKPTAQVSDLALAGIRGGAMQGHGRLSGLGFQPVGRAPGLSGLAGEFHGDGQGFELQLDAGKPLRFDWPSGFGVPHDVDLSGKLVGWREGAGWRIATSSLDIRGKDYGAHVRGGLWFQGDGTRPRIDVAAELDDAPVLAAKRFWIHHSMPKAAVDWLNASLQGGQVRGGRAIVSGDLDEWPFVDNNGRFEAVARIEDGQFKFQRGWPALEHVDADVAFIGNGFTLGGQGRLAGVNVARFDAGIAEFKQAELKISAQAAADASGFLRLLKQSPLHSRYGETLDNLQVNGQARASFNLLQPLDKDIRTPRQMDGTVDLANAELTEKRWDLAFNQVRGKVRYEDGGFVAEDLAVNHEGRPGVLSLRAGNGVRDAAHAFEAELAATLDADELLERAPELAWLKPHVNGQSQWTVGMAIPREDGASGNVQPTRLQLRSGLLGTALTLPAPLDKAAAVPLNTTVTTPLPLGSGQIEVAFGQRLALRARSQGEQTGIRVALGSATVSEAPPASGLIATGRTDSLDAVEWIALAQGGRGDGGGLPLRRIDVTADRLLMIGSEFADTRLQVAPSGNALAVTLEGPALAGSLLVPEAQRQPIAGKLSRLHWRSAKAGATPSSQTAAAVEPADDLDPASVPALSLEVEDLRVGDARLGNARLRTHSLPNGMQVEQLQLRSPKQQIDVAGTWTGRGAAARTQLAATVTSEDFGALMDDLGYRNRVGGGHGQATFELGWTGAPAAFRLSALEGSIGIAARDGHLLELEPGAGRVLGLLSVAEVRRRLMLDFSDFFAKGFAFNRLEGKVNLHSGLARSEDLVIDGPSAEIRIRGDTDLRAERFDQTIEVVPKSANVLTAVGAVAGGPLGAAVGAVANAVLRKPLGEMGAKTYRVTGPWKDPKVEVMGREQSRAAQANRSGRGAP